ncbi:L,D-transpeptidase [Amycolatopsis acidicola]|uniref:L,D-transpeptidase n=1 Tax=Amycolatopsis acidicola TaxID=2596893 RepID=A0A5N0VGL4_9PSEU|nr:L,D-transpeptidase [Amycolatopsis acidicola]KAA9163971.1 L,D-transpeptidase [Amycolatopsis acidicola]
MRTISRSTTVVATITALVALVGVVLWARHSNETPGGGAEVAITQGSVLPPRPVPDLAGLPMATTFATLEGAPPDLARDQPLSGQVVHPRRTVAIYAGPGGDPLAALPTEQVGGSPTWLPVIAEEPGWVQVLLPSRPNGSTGWLSTQDNSLIPTQSPFRIIVKRDAFQLSLYRDDSLVGTWVVGVGKAGAQTPAGRTFILAAITDAKQRFSPVILPLGTHSSSLETYGGGPGTTGIHGWPTDTVFGNPSSEGCVRVPADALRILSGEVPLGTPVLIS